MTMSSPLERLHTWLCREFKVSIHTQRQMCQRIHFKGEGKLKQPTRATLDIIEKCDTIVNQFNKSSLRLCHDPLGKVVNIIINKHPTFPIKIVKLFCKVYFYSRIRQIFNDIKMKKIKRSFRSMKQMGQFIN